MLNSDIINIPDKESAIKKSSEISAFDIKAFLKTLTERPGVYRMLDDQECVIYIGKAKNLRKRVSSYFRNSGGSPKQQAMVAHIRSIEVTVTHTEGEALLLEGQQVKKLQPRYNITLRDDKSYPYIYVTTQHDFPRVTFHRGAKRAKGRYFGPYPSAGAVREGLKLLQKIFPVRQCEESYYKNRSRPCLEYQIERCTAPCVGLIDKDDYQRDVEHTLMFLEGKGELLIDALVQRMEQASERLDFEAAMRYRNQIAALRTILEKQYVHGDRGDVDIIACAVSGSVAAVQLLFIRQGQQLGSKTLFPKMPEDGDAATVMEAFLPQYYADKPVPNEILVSHSLVGQSLLEQALSCETNHSVTISTRLRGERSRWLGMAQMNADDALKTHLAKRQVIRERFINLQAALKCKSLPTRLECFDISHTMGKQTVASCVVFDHEGAVKSDYRRFNISGITPGDDYAALSQAVTRRYRRLQKEGRAKPDILLIDGGKGQLSVVHKAMQALAIDDVMLVGVAKGADRIAGMERLFLPGESEPIAEITGSGALLLIQQIRDEAHRFAITGHRQRRAKAATQSQLEMIEGLGPKRRETLLKQFGGLSEVKKAGIDALNSVNGISRQLAQRIYNTFHE